MATKKDTKKNADDPKDDADWQKQWAQIQEDASEMQEVLPRLKFSLNPSARDGTIDRAKVRFEQPQPTLVQYTDKETGEENAFPVIEVTDLGDGQRKTMAVSAKSLQNAVGRISKEHNGDLTGVRAEVRVEGYTHPKFGPNTPGYRASEIQDLEAEEAAPEA